MIRSDNGSPFASSNGLLGLSKLSTWWLSLGINLKRSRPACPQDNGAHERMHLDIYRELQKEGVGFDPGAFDIWREEYNSQRPHASLGMQMPDEVYVKSSKPFDPSTKELDYGDLETRKVHPKNGTISYEKECYKISSALGGYTVGLKATGIHHTEVWFSHLLLGHIDHRVHTFTPISHDSLSKARTETTEV